MIVNDRQASRQHAKIIREGERYKLLDLHSKNGTFLNGTPLDAKPQYLSDGNQIGIALGNRLVFVDAGATAPLFVESELKAEIKLDQTAKRVWVMGKELAPPLSLAQYKLLDLLFSRQGGVVSRDDVVATVWSDEESDGVSEQAIDALARRLRERIAEVDPATQYVITVRGHGFRLDNYAG